MLNANDLSNSEKSFEYLKEVFNELPMGLEWLGQGNTSELIIKHLKEFLN
jgi:hypothetical protein